MKVKKKHLTGAIADFPLHVVQAMVDEQVRQGNPADPSVFAEMVDIGRGGGGFDWNKSAAGWDFWPDVVRGRKFHLIPKPEKPKGHPYAKLMKQYAKDAKVSETPWDKWEARNNDTDEWRPLGFSPIWNAEIQYRRKSGSQAETASEKEPTPNEIIKAMLDKGLIVWATTSDHSYDDARSRMDRCIRRVVEYDDSNAYPVRMKDVGWRYAIPVDTTTSTEITEMP